MKTLFLISIATIALIAQACNSTTTPQKQEQLLPTERFTSNLIISNTQNKQHILILPQNKSVEMFFMLQVDKLPEGFSKGTIQDAVVLYDAEKISITDSKNNKMIFCIADKCNVETDSKTKVYKGVGLSKITLSAAKEALISSFTNSTLTFEPVIEGCDCVAATSSANCACAGGEGATTCSCGGGSGCSVACSGNYYACCSKKLTINEHAYDY